MTLETIVNGIEERYRSLTPASEGVMKRAAAVMPGGNTRTTGWFKPYPVVFERGSGPYLYDVDGRDYIDLFFNGLSIIHGHGYAPIADVMERVARTGTGWVGASLPQVEFAELLIERVPSGGMVRFVNTGTEATMLAVKIARRVIGRPAILKARAGYHGSYDDLEVGLQGQGEVAGRAYLATFNDLSSFEQAFAEHGSEIAGVILESVMYTGVATLPDPGFLLAVQELAHRHGALFILDDCLMFRLASGGSAEKYGLAPDLTALGKFVGGGVPLGAVVGAPWIMSVLDPNQPDRLYHGGSFNGHVMAVSCGKVAIEDLDQSAIDQMDLDTDVLRRALEAHASQIGIPFITSGEGSIFGAYLTAEVPGSVAPRKDVAASKLFQLAAISHGVSLGDGNEFALSTMTTRTVVDGAIERLSAALDDVAGQLS